MSETNEILKKQIATAPKEIRAFLVKGSWLNVSREIAKKNNFSEDQTTSIEDEVLFVLIGLELKKDFKENIKRELYIPDILVRDMVDEIEERVFKEVNDFLPTEVEGETSITNPIPQKPIASVAPTQSAPANVVSTTPNNLPGAKPALDILQKQSSLPTTSLEQTLSQKTTSTENPVIEKKYYPGQDPYREPV
jgi:hypothetical protein